MLTTEQRAKRVAIAQDVLLQLAAERYKARADTYYMPAEFGVGYPTSWDRAAVEPCQVCAMGAVFLSKVRLFDDAPNNASPRLFVSDDLEANLVALFPDIRRIEDSFMDSDLIEAEEETDAMVDVMLEIIASDGALVESAV